MNKELGNSRIDRQNILNNDLAINEIQNKTNVKAIIYDGNLCFTKAMAADFFEIDLRTIERYIANYSDELKSNGYQILKGKQLKDFANAYADCFGADINVGTKTTVLGIFNFKAFLNIAMLLSESEKAKILRQFILDIVIDLINTKAGVGTKYINQNDNTFILASLQEDNYRQQFIDALKNYVCDDKFKYVKFTDMIYVSIFKENADEYKKILDLKSKDKVRDTLYSEILRLISSFECGFADILKKENDRISRILSIEEAMCLFVNFEQSAHWIPLLYDGRVKMASRDLALREAFHFQLSEYIKPLDKEDFKKFLEVKDNDLDNLINANKDVLKRLKEHK